MNKQEKELIKKLANISSLKTDEINEIIENDSFEEAQKYIYDVLKEDGIKHPKILLKKYSTYCISENDNFDKMINDLKKFTTKIQFEIDIDISSYMINNNEKINRIIANYLENNIKYYTLSKLLSFSNLASTFIETYCDINNINIIDDTINDSSVTDGMNTYIQKIPEEILTREQELELYIRYHNGDEAARDELTIHNLRLVLSIASRFTNRGIDFDDLVQAGNEGLMRAVEKFDATKGYKLSTYATWWIRQAITREIDNNGRSIRIPVHMLDRIKNYKKMCAEFNHDNGTLPTDKEIMEKMGINKEQLESIKKFLPDAVSLDTPVGEVEHGEQSTLGDFVEQTSLPLPEDNAIDNDIKNKVMEALIRNKRIDERAIEILKYRTGFYGKIYTLEEVGKIYNVTRERIRQIEAKALRILKNDKSLRNVADNIGIKISKYHGVSEITPEKASIAKSFYYGKRKIKNN